MRQWQKWLVLGALALGAAAPAAWADPPAWAPAHGYRRHARTVYVARPVVIVPGPFIYNGITYIPLQDAASLLGIGLGWDPYGGNVTFVLNGRNFSLVVGSRRMFYGDEVVLLPAPPLVIGSVVYVPVTFVQEYLGIPWRHDRDRIELRGPRGWHPYRLYSAPPGRISYGRGRLAPAPEPRVRTRGRVQTVPMPSRQGQQRMHLGQVPRLNERGAAPRMRGQSPERMQPQGVPPRGRAEGYQNRGQNPPGRQGAGPGEHRGNGREERHESGQGQANENHDQGHGHGGGEQH